MKFDSATDVFWGAVSMAATIFALLVLERWLWPRLFSALEALVMAALS